MILFQENGRNCRETNSAYEVTNNEKHNQINRKKR